MTLIETHAPVEMLVLRDIVAATGISQELAKKFYEATLREFPEKTQYVVLFEQPAYIFVIRDVIAFMSSYPNRKFSIEDINAIIGAIKDVHKKDSALWNLYGIQHRIAETIPQCFKNGMKFEDAIEVLRHGRDNCKSDSKDNG
jgi:hypothetical protein